MGGNRVIEFSGIKICLNEFTYEPAEDTKILLDMINVKLNEKVIDLGSGSGILGIKALLSGGKVIFIDINPYATEATLCSLRINKLDGEIINCDLLSCLREYKFDTIIFNPPYLPYSELSNWLGYSWSGGKGGIEVIERFLMSANSKRIYLVYSTLSDYEKVERILNYKGYNIIKKREVTIGFETIIGIEAVKDDKSNLSRT
ncbi:MAG: methyltransferase [Sulfolobaceae archaeon]